MFPFPFRRAPRDHGNGNREPVSAREHVADAVPAEESVGDEGGERRLQRGVPDLAELAERGRGQGRRGAVELREDAVLDGERDRAARDGLAARASSSSAASATASSAVSRWSSTLLIDAAARCSTER
ncbi:MAG: hypothetical protein HS111_04700 [Kofleriaceae bacterium]|nr:hypothetical protein [Kofleriaceae bacterium]